MIHRVAPITRPLRVRTDIRLWHLHAQLLKSPLLPCHLRSLHESVCVQRPLSLKFHYLKWKHFKKPQTRGGQDTEQLLLLPRLHSDARCLKPPTSCLSAVLTRFLSNVRNTLTELLSKILNIKPNASQVNKEIETGIKVKSKSKEKNMPTVDHSPPSATMATPTPMSTISNLAQAAETTASGQGKTGSTSGVPNGSETIPATMHSQGEKEQTADIVSKADTLASEPTTTSASTSAQSDQSFIDSYIAPLIPKFRATESTSTGGKKSEETHSQKVKEQPADPVPKTGEKTSEEKPAAEATVGKERKATEEKGLSVVKLDAVSADSKTRRLVHLLHRASGKSVHINTVEDLNSHLLEFPETCSVAVEEDAIACLLRLRRGSDPDTRAAIRQALSLVGYADPVKGRGVRVLSIDGGGLRGLVALQTLRRLESLTQRPIHELFDYIGGVSAGALIGFMLAINRLSVDECIERYKKFGPSVFKQHPIVGRWKMVKNHAFYSSDILEKTLKEQFGTERVMAETSRDAKCPKLGVVSTIVNRGTPLKAYVFRNYNLLPGVHSSYLGGCQHKLWQAIRASTAAPGYFEELTLGGDMHADGGLLMNNPTFVAIDECKSLWRDVPLECVVSVGTGRFATIKKSSSVSLWDKMDNFISSATDTEVVHAMLRRLLPPDTYFRFNPRMSEAIGMDEVRVDKMDLLEAECIRYLDRNEEAMKRVVHTLTREKGFAQGLVEWFKLKSGMFNGPPPLSSDT